MKQSIKISVMALVAMFAFSTVADAQFGKLLKKAKSAVVPQQSSGNMTEKSKAYIPQIGQTPSGVVFTYGGAEVAKWDGAKNELTVTTDLNGNTPGSVLKIDPATGKVTDASGKAMGALGKESIEDPNGVKITLQEKITWDNLSGVSSLTGYEFQMAGKTVCSYIFKNPRGGVSSVFNYGNKECKVSDRSVGASLVAYVFCGLLIDKKEMTVKALGYDPDRKYTTAELNDLQKWQDDDTEAEILKIEKGKTFSDNRVKGSKVAAIGLMGEWESTTWTRNSGEWNEFKFNVEGIDYWVVYELPNGENKVAFYHITKNADNKGRTERGSCKGFHNLTDWQRK